MAQIPRKYIDNYTKALNKLSADAQKRLADDLAKINFDGNIATIRDVFINRLEFYCGPYTDMAAILAAEFYDGLRKFQVGSALGALAQSGREPIATEKAVRAIVQDLVDGKPPETVVKKLVDRVDFEIKRSAGECVYRNGERDPLKPRFARVPAGSETCSFCIMLASRGFVYLTKESAGENNHYHAHCDCRIVPGFDGETVVPGYDPDTLYDQWKHPEKYPELQEARNARRRELYAARIGENRVSEAILPAVDPSKANSYTVNRKTVNTASFRQRFNKLNMPKAARNSLYDNSIEILKETDGTPYERLVYIDKRTGNIVASTFDDPPRKLGAELNATEREKLLAHNGDHVILHNHPGSTYPSLADIFSASKSKTSCSVIACHDGDLFVIECTKHSKGYAKESTDVTRLQEIIYNLIDEAKEHASSESEANLLALMALEKMNKGNKWYKITKISG